MLGGLFGGKAKRDKFYFSIELHWCAPIPEMPSNRSITVAWNRGKKRQGMLGFGYTQPFRNVPRGRGRLGHEVQMGYQAIMLGATLERLPRNGSALQEYKKKCLVIAILETNTSNGESIPMGRVVMDLADFALINGQEMRSFIVTCRKEVTQQVGHPQLLVTIKNLPRKGSLMSSGGRSSRRFMGLSGSSTGDDAASESDATSVSSYGTDGTGSAANVSSFLRYKYTGQMPAVTESAEQDLDGFEVMNPPGMGQNPTASPLTEDKFKGPGGAVPSGASLKGYMNTIKEDHGSGEEEESKPRAMLPSPAPSTPPFSRPSLRDTKPDSSPGAGFETEARSIASTILALPREEQGPLLAQLPFHQRAEVVKVLQNPSVLREPIQGRQPSLSPTPSGFSSSLPSASPSPVPAAFHTPHKDLSAAAVPEANRPELNDMNINDTRDVHPFCDLESLQQELLCTAAQEVCVLLARASAMCSPKGPKRSYHGPARRIARTLVCLGPAQTSDFALHLLRLIAVQVRTAGATYASELPTLCFWWSNLAHFRGLLLLPKMAEWLTLPMPPALETDGTDKKPASLALADPGIHSANDLHTTPSHRTSLALVLAPHVLRLERAAAEAVLDHVWSEVLLPMVTSAAPLASSSSVAPKDTKDAGADRKAGARTNVAAKRNAQEAAMQRWASAFEHLGRVLGQLGALPPDSPKPLEAAEAKPAELHQQEREQQEGTQEQQLQQQEQASTLGHTALLQRQVLSQCLARTDALLFYHLLTPPGTNDPSILADYTPLGSNSMWGRPGSAVPQLQDGALPFSRGVLSFGSGMHIKMAVTRMQQWATACEACLGVRASASTGSPRAGMFPLLRAAADLLMMPKELLLDEAVRKDVGQSLTARTQLQVLQGFQADEYEPEDGAAQSVATQLLDAPEFSEAQKATLQGSAYQGPQYQAPPGEALTAQVLFGTELNMEYDADSEDELMGPEGMAKRAAGKGKQARFEMLHSLWVSKRPMAKEE